MKGTYNRFAETFRDLIVYQKARSLAKDIFEFTLTLPKDEEFSLKDQNGMMDKADSFCHKKPAMVREKTAEYFIN